MAEHDLVVRGGTVIDGTGATRRTADVAVSDGVVVEVEQEEDKDDDEASEEEGANEDEEDENEEDTEQSERFPLSSSESELFDASVSLPLSCSVSAVGGVLVTLLTVPINVYTIRWTKRLQARAQTAATTAAEARVRGLC